MLDWSEGFMQFERGGGIMKPERGPTLASVAPEGEPFEVLLRRAGTELIVVDLRGLGR